MSALSPKFKASRSDDGSWLSISDLMAGLMVIFLFIAIVYIRPVVQIQQEIEEITSAWIDVRDEIYEALNAEFQDDLIKWDAELEKETLTIRFRAPDILFEPNSALLSPRFKQILNSFFPRYLRVLVQFESELEEIRIEGHTSSEWSLDSTELESYFNNMQLSQMRTRSVLEYGLTLDASGSSNRWARSLFTANGLSFSRPVFDRNGREDRNKSRRVEFRIRTNADEKIQEIIQNLQ